MIQKLNIERSVYTKFKNQILTSGMIKWHHSEKGRNVCVMNDYSINRHLIPNSFIHVSSDIMDDDSPIIRCTCEIYNFIQIVEIEQETEILPDTSCMYCRFFSEHLLNAYELINEGQANIPRSLQIVKSSIQFMNDPVVLLGDVLCTGTTEYSVKGNDYFSLVIIIFYLHIIYMTLLFIIYNDCDAFFFLPFLTI